VTAPALKGAAKGTAASRRWTNRELRLRIAELKVHLASGLSDIEAAEKMELAAADYNVLKRELYAQERTDLVGKSTEEVYVDYVLRQERCIKDLDELRKVFQDSNQPNALVGAIRAKSEILDKIIARGQEFGIIEKVPDKKQVVGGFVVAQLDNATLRALITEQLKGLEQVVSRYGNTDMLGNPLDTPAKALQSPQAASIVESPPTIPPPQFTAAGKPATTQGGAKKAAGARAVNAQRRTKATAAPRD
jgi:hypothetical protein